MLVSNAFILHLHSFEGHTLLIARIFTTQILRNSQNIRAYFMLNHRIRCEYEIREETEEIFMHVEKEINK